MGRGVSHGPGSPSVSLPGLAHPQGRIVTRLNMMSACDAVVTDVEQAAGKAYEGRSPADSADSPVDPAIVSAVRHVLAAIPAGCSWLPPLSARLPGEWPTSEVRPALHLPSPDDDTCAVAVRLLP
ncbi:hypothetical protein [Micromonospora sp. NPDC003776]